MHAFTHSLVHAFACLLVCAFACSLVCAFTRLLVCAFKHLLIFAFADSLIFAFAHSRISLTFNHFIICTPLMQAFTHLKPLLISVPRAEEKNQECMNDLVFDECLWNVCDSRTFVIYERL